MSPTIIPHKTVRNTQAVPATTGLAAGVARVQPAPTHKAVAATTTMAVGVVPETSSRFLGVWPDSPTATVWNDLLDNTAGNHILGYRPRGNFGQFDQPMVPATPPARVKVYSTNLNPMTGKGSTRAAISLVDWASGVYDSYLLAQVTPMNNLIASGIRRVIVEIWSECNNQDPPGGLQPAPPDWSTANWEAAFLHTVDLWRTAGLSDQVWLGTSISALQSGFEDYATAPMLAVSDFCGFDVYAQAGSFKLITVRAANILAYVTAHDLPVIICESGVDTGEDYVTWFDDAYTFATTDGVAGIFITDYYNIIHASDYRVDAGFPKHATFQSFASKTGWQR